jgi:hypothetical protein
MKKSSVIFICVVMVALGSIVGYRVGLGRALHKIGDEMDMNQALIAQQAMQLEVRGYLDSLHALDSEKSDDIAALRKRALGHLRFYISSSEEMRRRYDWNPNPHIYSNASAYLAQHAGTTPK